MGTLNSFNAATCRLVSALAASRQRLTRVAALGAVAAGLGACLDGETNLNIDASGNANAVYEMRFDKEAEDIFDFLKVVGDMAPEAAVLKGGLCPAASMMSILPEFKGLAIKGSEFKQPNAYVCKLDIGVGPMTGFAEAIKKMDPWGMYEVKEVGPKRYMVALDYAKMPPFSEMMKEAQRKQAEATKAAGGSPPPGADMQAAIFDKMGDKLIKGGAAMVRLMAKGRKADMVISAPRIIESNGQIAPDKKSVRFAFTTEESITLLLDANARKGKRFFAVVEY